MSELVARILMTLLMKLVTEKFFGKFFTISADALAQKTTNKIDDKMVAAIAEALDVKLEH